MIKIYIWNTTLKTKDKVRNCGLKLMRVTIWLLVKTKEQINLTRYTILGHEQKKHVHKISLKLSFPVSQIPVPVQQI